MEDKNIDFTKPPPELKLPSGSRNIIQSFLQRQSGVNIKSCAIPTELQWAAEDKMIMRAHEEYKCELPDVPRSTFLMVFSPDRKKVASTHGNHNVYVTDVTSGKNVKTLTGHPRTPWCIAFHPSSNQILATGCLGGQVRVWDLSGGSEIWMAESQTVIASLAFHPVGRMLVIGTYNELHFWDWSQPEPFAKCFTSNEKEKIRYVAFDSLGHKLITGIANAPQRAPSQWDRVTAPLPPPPPQPSQSDTWGERHITICYRYMVQQYEQLVRRYCDLSRARSTLTMDRGTDPMELEEDSSNSHNTASAETGTRRPCHTCDFQHPPSIPSTSRARFSSGTDETSASHSSTNFLTPPEPSESEQSGQSQPFLTPEDTSPNGTTNSFLRNSASPRRNPRFDITLPSFSSFRTRSSSFPSSNSTGADPPSTFNRYPSDITITRSRTSVPQESTGVGRTRSESRSRISSPNVSGQSNTEESISRTPLNLRQRLRNLMFTLCSRRGTQVNSNVDSEFEEPEGSSELRQASQSDTDEHRSGSNTAYDPTSPPFDPSQRPSRSSTENSSRRLSEGFSVSQLRSQFHRLQSVYENRDSSSSSAHVFSPETMSAERRLLNRLHEILDEPLHEPSPRRLSVSQHSAFQPRAPQPPSRPAPQPPPDILRGVRYGIQLLSRHIDNMQRLCRARLEILQLQQIRRMWEDLQSQIHALHSAVRDSEAGQERGTATTTASTREQPVRVNTSTDLLTDDDSSDGPSSHGELHWRQRRTPQTSGRRNVRSIPPRFQPGHNHRIPTLKRSRGSSSVYRFSDIDKRMASMGKRMTQQAYSRRPHQVSSTTQDRGVASSSQVSGETSTGSQVSGETSTGSQVSGETGTASQVSGETSTASQVLGETSTGSQVLGETSTSNRQERGPLRGVKRKSRDSDPLFSPRPNTARQGQRSSTSANTSSGTSNNTASNIPPSNIAAVMRYTILQLESMVWRHRQATLQRNPRSSRFTRLPEERRMRNLWDTESSHESSRDDQSEGESAQRNTPGRRTSVRTTPEQNIPRPADSPDEWSIFNTRIRARQVLLLMVDSLTQFFENDNLSSRASNEALNDRISDLYALLQLALNLTDLLLAQLVHSRRELDNMYQAYYQSRNRSMSRDFFENYRSRRVQRMLRVHERLRVMRLRPLPVAVRHSFRRLVNNSSRPASSNRTAPAPASRVITTQSPLSTRALRALHSQTSTRNPHINQPRPVVPVVRVNDMPIPIADNPTFRFRPHSPPPISPHPMFVPARFLHPARYMGSGVVFDEFSTSEDSSSQDRGGDYFFMRAGYGPNSVVLSDTPMSPQHRLQAWDFSEYKLPDLGCADKNVVVSECKIHNDASVDISQDGRLLVALLPSGRVNMTTLLGVYSLQWDTLGQLLYTTSFEQSIVSVSLSPTTRHLAVGLASRRVALVNSDRITYAQVFRLEGASPGRKGPLGARGRLVHLRDLDLSRHISFMSLNCIRWAPNPGQGLVYGTNTGQLKILR